MNRTPSFHFVFFLPNDEPMRKVVTKEEYNSLAQDDVLRDVEIGKTMYSITKRRSFNRFDTSNADFFLIMDIILKTE